MIDFDNIDQFTPEQLEEMERVSNNIIQHRKKRTTFSDEAAADHLSRANMNLL